MAKKKRRAKTRDLPLKGKNGRKIKGGDEVVVAFEHGDLRSPVVVGSLWNGTDSPPTTSTKTSPTATLKKKT